MHLSSHVVLLWTSCPCSVGPAFSALSQLGSLEWGFRFVLLHRGPSRLSYDCISDQELQEFAGGQAFARL
jgi:hypothetical protein